MQAPEQEIKLSSPQGGQNFFYTSPQERRAALWQAEEQIITNFNHIKSVIRAERDNERSRAFKKSIYGGTLSALQEHGENTKRFPPLSARAYNKLKAEYGFDVFPIEEYMRTGEDSNAPSTAELLRMNAVKFQKKLVQGSPLLYESFMKSLRANQPGARLAVFVGISTVLRAYELESGLDLEEELLSIKDQDLQDAENLFVRVHPMGPMINPLFLPEENVYLLQLVGNVSEILGKNQQIGSSHEWFVKKGGAFVHYCLEKLWPKFQES